MGKNASLAPSYTLYYGPALSLVAWIIITCKFQTWGEALWCLCLSTGSRVLSAGLKG